MLRERRKPRKTKQKYPIAMHDRKGKRISLWQILAISFFIFISLVNADPQARRRRGEGRGFGPGSSKANANELVFSVNNQPELTVPLDDLTRDTHFLYYPMQFPDEVETARVIRGPPDVGFFFISPRNDYTGFASRTMFAPGASTRYSGARDILYEPFGYVGYIAFFLFPREMDPNHLMAALTLTTDDTFAETGETDFQLLFFDFTKPENRDLPAGHEFSNRVTIEKAAIVHSPNPYSRLTLYNAPKTEYLSLAPHYQLLMPFYGAKYVAAAESPEPGPIPLPDEFN